MDHSKHITISRFVKKKKTISFIDRSNISIGAFNHKFWYLFLNQILIIHYTIPMGREIKTNNSETIIIGVRNINQSFK